MAAQGTPPDDAQTTGDQARTELNRRVFRASHSRIPEIVEPARKIRRVLLQCLLGGFGSVFPQCGLMVFPGAVIVSR